MPPVVGLASIRKLPKADKTALLASFVTEQKTNAKLYAEQGLAVASRSPLSHVSLHTPPPASVRPCGFDTPVLKVRSTKNNVPLTLRSPTKKRKQSLPLPKADDPPQASQPSPRKPAPKQRKFPTLPPAKKQKLKEVPDDDHAARLAIRAQRRKETRAIARPVDDEECNSDDVPHKTKGSSNKPRKKDKVPPGLALMHGFSAANVGKGRLTAKVPVSAGVFSRGRASQRTKTRQDKNKAPAIFSEGEFLNPRHLPVSGKASGSANTKTISERRARGIHRASSLEEASASDDNDSAEVVTQRIHRKKNKPAAAALQARSGRLGSPSATSFPVKTSKPRNRRRVSSEVDSGSESPSEPVASLPQAEESEVWDIEKSDFVLPSRPPSLMNDTAVLDTRPTAWGAQLDADRHFDDPVSELRLPSSPSLGPSQSTSQQGIVRAPAKSFMQDAPVVSKYFASHSPARARTKYLLPARTNTPPSVSPALPRVAPLSSPMHRLGGQSNMQAHAVSDLAYDVLGEDELDAHYTACNYAANIYPRETSFHPRDEYDRNYDHNLNDAESDRYVIFDDAETPMDAMYFEEYDCSYRQDMDMNCHTMDQQNQSHGWPAEADEWDDNGDEWNVGEEWDQDEGQDMDTGVNDVLWDQVGQVSESMETSDSDELNAVCFQGGRELLRGIGVERSFARSMRHPTSSAEDQVARTLNGHWRPQRL